MQRISIECLGGGDFANLAQIHDRHPVGDVPHYAHVVGDEHIGEVLLLLQLDEHVDDLGLDGDIQRRGWLIQNDELGIAAQCPGYGDQLLLTATDGVRRLVHEVGGKFYHLQNLKDLIVNLVLGNYLMYLQRQTQNAAHILIGV